MSSSQQSSRREEVRNNKLFISNLDGKVDPEQLKEDLTKQFQKYGSLLSIVVKKNRNSDNCFSFAEMKDSTSAADVIKNCDQAVISGKQIKVQLQDDNKRRKDSNLGCYNCGKKGHFARQCKAPRNDDRGQGRRDRYRNSRSRSRSQSYHRKKHKKRYRSRSRSYSRDRSYDRSKKRKRDYSRDRDERKKKKHKKRSYS